MYTVCFGLSLIHPRAPSPHPVSFLYPFSSFFFFSLIIHCIQLVLECGDTHWNMVNLPGGLKKMDSPSPSCHLQPRASQAGVEPCWPFAHPCWNVDCLDLGQVLCRSAELQWVHECGCPGTSRRYREDRSFFDGCGWHQDGNTRRALGWRQVLILCVLTAWVCTLRKFVPGMCLTPE